MRHGVKHGDANIIRVQQVVEQGYGKTADQQSNDHTQTAKASLRNNAREQCNDTCHHSKWLRVFQFFPEIEHMIDQMQAGRHIYTDKLLRLLGRNQTGCARGETNHNRVGDKVDQRTESYNTHDQLQNSDHESQRDCKSDIFLTARRCDTAE